MLANAMKHSDEHPVSTHVINIYNLELTQEAAMTAQYLPSMAKGSCNKNVMFSGSFGNKSYSVHGDSRAEYRANTIHACAAAAAATSWTHKGFDGDENDSSSRRVLLLGVEYWAVGLDGLTGVETSAFLPVDEGSLVRKPKPFTALGASDRSSTARYTAAKGGHAQLDVAT